MPAQKPYLERLDTSPAGVAATMEWASYLGDTFGANAALNSLQYYERLGWISEPVREQLTTYLQGLSADEIHNKKYEEPASLDPPLESLSGTPFGAHARSLSYIADIAGHDLEEHRMMARLAERRTDTPVPVGDDAGEDVWISPTIVDE